MNRARVAMLVFVLAGCGSGRELAPAPAVVGDCSDADGDGFGAGCAPGPDCDDRDPSVHEGCPPPDLCREGLESCPCDAEGAFVDCGIVPQHYGDVTQCPRGRSRCDGGRWSACAPVGPAYGNVPSGAAGGLGIPMLCKDACDPGCKDTGSVTAGACQTGICTGSIAEAPDGVTLHVVGDASPPLLASSLGTCAHHLCEAGSAAPLAPGCDQLTSPAGCALHVLGGRTYLFCGGAKDWAGARTACLEQGLDLVTVTDAMENGSVGATAAAAWGGEAFWIGLHRGAGQDSLRWAGGQGLTFLNLGPEGDGDCVEQTALAPHAWHPQDCGEKRPFVCEGVPLAPPGASCVAQVCALLPSCCTTQWSTACLALARSTCAFDCAAVSGFHAFCFRDGLDHDGDGWSFEDGDQVGGVSRDCLGGSNPGAFDVPGNQVDEDCNGVVDDAAPCDGDLELAGTSADDFARALELCRSATADAVGPAKTWGVIQAALVRADGVSPVGSLKQHAILPSFGTTTTLDPSTGLAVAAPREGARMVAFSTGTARRPGDPGFTSPFASAGSAWVDAVPLAPPPGFPHPAPGCPVGAGAYDSAGLKLQVRAPTNAQSFSYALRFFSATPPSAVCTPFDDQLAVRVFGGHPAVSANETSTSGANVTFDADGTPLGASANLLTVVGSSSSMAGTGYDGPCDGGACGASTGWLRTHVPVLAGETFTFHLGVWDTGNGLDDSLVLLDAWRWSADSRDITTKPDTKDPGPVYGEGSLELRYDHSALCNLNEKVSYASWSWVADTPSDTEVRFYVRAGATVPELEKAKEGAIELTTPPGPAALAGKPAVAAAALGTSTGGAWIGKNLERLGFDPHAKHVAIRAHLVPSSDGHAAPTLGSWYLSASCVAK